MRSLLLVIATAALCLACQRTDKDSKAKPGSGAGTGAGTGAAPAQVDPLESADILARPQVSEPSVHVKHVLVGWKEINPRDPRAQARSKADADKLAKEILAKVRANADIDALMKEHSEDPGSAQSARAYEVKPGGGMVAPFEKLSLRLKEGEAGLVKTQFGWHVIKRVAPPPPPAPDPLESADILARPPVSDASVWVKHVLVSWKDAPGARDPRAQARSKEDADKLAKEILDKVRAKGDIDALMKEHSEDPGSNKNARAYEVKPGGGMVAPFENMSMRLQEGEAGLVKTQFGWHVIKRVPKPPPPKPDPLDSVDILKREPKTAKATVKHILVGWTEVNADDPRAKARSRKDLEKLVKATVAKLKKGDPIEPLMAELSEDPGSAKSGEGYDVTPQAGLVEPFKNLSLRLDVKEVGVVKTDFGIHIIQRVE